MEPNVGLDLMTGRSWPEPKSWVRCLTDSATQAASYFFRYKLIYAHCKNTDRRIKKKMCPMHLKTITIFSSESSEILLWVGRFHRFHWVRVNLKNNVKVVFRCLTLEICYYISFLESACVHSTHLLRAGFFCFFFLRFYLFIHRDKERERGRDTGRGRSRLHAESPTWDSILGIQDHTLGCRRRQTTVPLGLPEKIFLNITPKEENQRKI